MIFTLHCVFLYQLIPESAAKYVSLLAGACIFTAQIILLIDVVKRKMRPGILSWAGWALLMGTSLVAQLLEKGWHASLTGLLLSTCGCIVISVSAWLLKNYLIKKSDWYFLLLGLACLFIYLLSKNAWITTCFAILADFIVGIPTLRHAYYKPLTQKTKAWFLGFISWSITLLLCIGHSWLFALFPMYLFLYNGLMIRLTNRKTKIPQQV